MEKSKRLLCILIVSSLVCACLVVVCSATNDLPSITELYPMPSTTPLPYYPEGAGYYLGGEEAERSAQKGYGNYIRQSISLYTVVQVEEYHAIPHGTDVMEICYSCKVATHGSNQPESAYAENFRVYLPAACTSDTTYGEMGKVAHNITGLYSTAYDVEMYVDNGVYRVPLSQTRTMPQTTALSGYQNFAVLYINISSTNPSQDWFIVATFDFSLFVARPSFGDGLVYEWDSSDFFDAVDSIICMVTPIMDTGLMLAILDILTFGMAVHYVIKLAQ